MKKTIIVLSLAVLGFSASAQDSLLVNKSGTPMLPKKGDIGIGLDATPFLNYAGNMFNNTTNNKLDLKQDNVLYFRYFLKDDAAIRVALRIASTNELEKYNVTDDAATALDPLSKREVEDRSTIKNNAYALRIGYQQFRGYKKLKGFYGADLGFAYENGNTKYEYGNKMNELNPAPSTMLPVTPGDRTLEIKDGTIKTLSLGAFGGAEYYFMPKVCVGLEVGILYGTSWESQSYEKDEHMVISQRETHTQVTSAGGRNRFLGTTYPYTYGNLYFMIHL